jgi:PAS domain S-box-containing protein
VTYPDDLSIRVHAPAPQAGVEDALRRYAEEVHDLYNNAPCGYHSLDPNGAFLEVNDTELQWLGYKREEVVGRLRFADVLTAASARAFERAFVEFKRAGAVTNLEFELLRKDGTTFPAVLNATAVTDPAGNYLRSRSTLFDLSERRAADRRFRDLLEAAPDASVIVDETATIVLVNAQTEKLFGYDRDELIGQPVEILVPDHAKRAHEEHRDSFVDDPRARPMGAGFELYGRRKDGSEFPVEISLAPLRIDEGTLVSSSIRDVTDRRDAEIAARRLAAIVDDSYDAIISSGPDGAIATWNCGAERVFGHTSAEMVGRPIGPLIFPDDEAEERRTLDRVLAGEKVEHHEAKGLRKSGDRVELSLALSPIRDAKGTIVGASAIARDMTEAKRAQREAERLKEEFFGLVSHDLRTPLTSIKGYTELLLDSGPEDLSGEARKFVETIERNTERLERLVGDLLFAAQVEAGTFEIKLDEADLEAVVRECAEAIRAQADQKRIALSLEVEPIPMLRGDPGRLSQLLENLASNAIKYTPEAGRVTIRAGTAESLAFVEVVDTGVGIPARDQPQIFHRFFRTSQTAMVPGVGLGLTIVKAIAEAHGGRVSLQSSDGVGSTFRVELPLPPS